MKKEILPISGHEVKDQGQILTLCMYKTLRTQYRLQLLSNHFQT